LVGEDIIVLKLGEKGKEPILEHICTPGSLENVLSWGDELIPEPLEEVTKLELITCD
jgi:hypothetical protein